jgi:hypothetical protein
MDQLQEQYMEEKYEARAMGVYDFPSFDEWSGVVSARECADVRVAVQYDNDTQDL